MVILNDFNKAVERRMSEAALEFALDRFQDALLSRSIDAQLAAAQLLFDSGKLALAHLAAVQTEYRPLGIA